MGNQHNSSLVVINVEIKKKKQIRITYVRTDGEKRNSQISLEILFVAKERTNDAAVLIDSLIFQTLSFCNQ